MTATAPELPPIDDAEHAARRERVRARMAERGIDVLYVTSPANLVWLTGYEAAWYPPRMPVGAAIVGATGEVVWFDWTRHEDYARAICRCDAFVWFDYGDAVGVVAAEAARRGWDTGTIGVERSALNPAPGVVIALEAALAATGATVVPGDWLVDGARVHKSPAEVLRVRAAARIADAAMRELQRRLRPGMTELQVSALIHLLLADEGSQGAANQPLVSSGPTAWRDVHAYPSHRTLEPGDLVSVDCCAVVERYHANLSRVFVLGDEHPEAAALLEAAHGVIPELQAHARLDEDPAPAMARAEAYARDRIAPEKLWWVGGYALGVALPPSWVGTTYLANDGVEPIVLREGYVSNFETVVVDEVAGFEACCIDTLLMTRDGLEVLSELPRQVLPVALDGAPSTPGAGA